MNHDCASSCVCTDTGAFLRLFLYPAVPGKPSSYPHHTLTISHHVLGLQGRGAVWHTLKCLELRGHPAIPMLCWMAMRTEAQPVSPPQGEPALFIFPTALSGVFSQHASIQLPGCVGITGLGSGWDEDAGLQPRVHTGVLQGWDLRPAQSSAPCSASGHRVESTGSPSTEVPKTQTAQLEL